MPVLAIPAAQRADFDAETDERPEQGGTGNACDGQEHRGVDAPVGEEVRELRDRDEGPQAGEGDTDSDGDDRDHTDGTGGGRGARGVGHEAVDSFPHCEQGDRLGPGSPKGVFGRLQRARGRAVHPRGLAYGVVVLSVPVDNVLRPVVEFMKGRGTCGM